MNEMKSSPRLAITITNAGNEKKLIEVFESAGIPVSFMCHGQGTAPSAIMDLFGLSGREKLITAGFTDKTRTAALFKHLEEKLSFSQKGHGIAFTLSPKTMQSKVMALLKGEESIQGEESGMNEHNHDRYAAILVAVAGGFSEDVVEAAHSAGAQGGTVIKGMREWNREAATELGTPIKEEQDFVLILVPKENKTEIMNAITVKCGINTEAHGIVSSFALDEVFGI